MSIGDRVVRGPDWQTEEQADGGEGGVGTIVSVDNFDDGSSLPDNHVLVYWDIGFLSCYRAGFDGYHDLRIFDSAPAGVIFHSVTCDGCNQPRIAGTRWHCAACNDYNLCTTCYMNDEHDTSHNFKVFQNDTSQGMIVGKRSKAAKIRAKGIFPGAKVKTGRDWDLQRLNDGIVLEISPMDDLQRSAVLVKWANFCDMSHRVGYKGKVDLEVMQSSEGPYYYKTHLPLVSLNDTMPLSGSEPYVVTTQQHMVAAHKGKHEKTQKNTLRSTPKESATPSDLHLGQIQEPPVSPSTPGKSAPQTMDKTYDLKPPQKPSFSFKTKLLENTKEISSKTVLKSTSKRPPSLLPKPKRQQPKPQEISIGDTQPKHGADCQSVSDPKESVRDIITKMNTFPSQISSKTRQAPPPLRPLLPKQPTEDNSTECNSSQNSLTLTGPPKRNMVKVTGQTSYQGICTICDELPDIDKCRVLQMAEGDFILKITQIGGKFSIPQFGILIEFQPHCVTNNTEITFRLRSVDAMPSPCGDSETLVSYIVELCPDKRHKDLRISALVTIMHSGPEKQHGYETVVKALNDKKQHMPSWEVVEEYKQLKPAMQYKCIPVEINRLTALAVVARLITDRFEVTPSGCVVTSSVCKDVTVTFPKGAVDRTHQGSMKVLLMPNFICQNTKTYPCPILYVNGFDGVQFLKFVTIRMLHPCPAIYPAGQIRVMCLKHHQWEDITDQSDRVNCVEHKSSIEIQIRHFSVLWPWIPVVRSSFLRLYQCLSKAPQAVCFAAFKDDREQSVPPRKVTLLCVANHDEQNRIKKMEDDGYIRLARTTSDRDMRPDDQAFAKLDGNFEQVEGIEDFSLRFVENEPCIKELCIQKRNENNNGILICGFYLNKEKTEDHFLCKLTILVETGIKERRDSPQTPDRSISTEHYSPDSTKVYKMKSSPRGLAVIINMNSFASHNEENIVLEERVGCKSDLQSLSTLMAFLDFECKRFFDKGKDELLAACNEISKSGDLANYDCFAMFIMTHGETGNVIYASDGEKIEESFLVDMFGRCEALSGKPKLFFFQTCRGVQIDLGRYYHDGNSGKEHPDIANLQYKHDGVYIGPITSDILVSHSCYQGYKAYRSTYFGSIFIQSLVKIFTSNAKHKDLKTMLTMVNDNVSKVGCQIGAIQMPVFMSTLRKPLYF